MAGYLPKESPISKLNKTILRSLWNNKLISKSLGVKNEDKARTWFGRNQYAHKRFEKWNKELEEKMKELQREAGKYLSLFRPSLVEKRNNKSRIQPKSKRKKL